MIFEYKDLTEGEVIVTDLEGNETTEIGLINPTSLITIEEGLELSNPKMEIMSVYYNLKTNKFNIEIYFWETKFIHLRSFEAVNPNPGSLNMEAIMIFIMTHPILSKFTPQV